MPAKEDEKWRMGCGVMGRIIVCEFRPRYQINPVVLVGSYTGSLKILKLLVGALSEPIRLGMIG